jgi:outer membrane protein, heavy metal efflux system
MTRAAIAIQTTGSLCLVLIVASVGAAESAWARRASPAIEPPPAMERAPTPLPPVAAPDPWKQVAPMAGVPPQSTDEGTRSLTLDDMRAIAQQNNPTLIQAHMAVRAAQGEQIQAGLCPNPEIGYEGGDVGLEGTSGQQGSVIAQEFVTAGKLRIAANAAGHGVTATRHGLEAQRWRVMNSVRSGFYEVLLAQKMVSINEDLVRVGNQAEDITSRLRAAQEVSKADVLQASIEAERAKVSLFMARNRHRIAWYQLAAMVGQPEMPSATLLGDVIQDLPAVTWDEGLTRLLSGSPELAQAHAKVKQARCEVALQVAERHANVSVGAGVKYDATAEQSLADVGVAIPLKIFDRNQGNIVSAQAHLIAATREVERLELDLFNRFAKAFETYSNANRQVELFRSKVLDNARESLELVGAGYREGEFDYLSLLTAQRTFFGANLEYLDALQELWSSSVELDGLMLTGGLEAVE